MEERIKITNAPEIGRDGWYKRTRYKVGYLTSDEDVVIRGKVHYQAGRKYRVRAQYISDGRLQVFKDLKEPTHKEASGLFTVDSLDDLRSMYKIEADESYVFLEGL